MDAHLIVLLFVSIILLAVLMRYSKDIARLVTGIGYSTFSSQKAHGGVGESRIAPAASAATSSVSRFFQTKNQPLNRPSTEAMGTIGFASSSSSLERGDPLSVIMPPVGQSNIRQLLEEPFGKYIPSIEEKSRAAAANLTIVGNVLSKSTTFNIHTVGKTVANRFVYWYNVAVKKYKTGTTFLLEECKDALANVIIFAKTYKKIDNGVFLDKLEDRLRDVTRGTLNEIKFDDDLGAAWVNLLYKAENPSVISEPSGTFVFRQREPIVSDVAKSKFQGMIGELKRSETARVDAESKRFYIPDDYVPEGVDPSVLMPMNAVLKELENVGVHLRDDKLESIESHAEGARRFIYWYNRLSRISDVNKNDIVNVRDSIDAYINKYDTDSDEAKSLIYAINSIFWTSLHNKMLIKINTAAPSDPVITAWSSFLLKLSNKEETAKPVSLHLGVSHSASPPLSPVAQPQPSPVVQPQQQPPSPPPSPVVQPQQQPPSPVVQPQQQPPSPVVQPQQQPPSPVVQPQQQPPSPVVQPQPQPVIVQPQPSPPQPVVVQPQPPSPALQPQPSPPQPPSPVAQQRIPPPPIMPEPPSLFQGRSANPSKKQLADELKKETARRQFEKMRREALREQIASQTRRRSAVVESSSTDNIIPTIDPRNPTSIAQYLARYHITATSRKLAELMTPFPGTELLGPADITSADALVHIKHYMSDTLTKSLVNENRFTPREQWARDDVRQKFFFDQLTRTPNYYVNNADLWKSSDKILRYVPIAPPEMIASIISKADPRKILDMNVMFGSAIVGLALATPQSASYDALCMSSARFGLETLLSNISARPTFKYRINLIVGSAQTWVPARGMYDMVISEIRTRNSEVISREPPQNDSADTNTYIGDRIKPMISIVSTAMMPTGTAVFLLVSKNPDYGEIAKAIASIFKIKETIVSGEYTALVCGSV